LSRGLYGLAGITAAPKCAERSSYVRLSCGSYLLAFVTPTRGLLLPLTQDDGPGADLARAA
jgi:hypothetical protein